jgi:hypothetical protein
MHLQCVRVKPSDHPSGRCHGSRAFWNAGVIPDTRPNENVRCWPSDAVCNGARTPRWSWMLCHDPSASGLSTDGGQSKARNPGHPPPPPNLPRPRGRPQPERAGTGRCGGPACSGSSGGGGGTPCGRTRAGVCARGGGARGATRAAATYRAARGRRSLDLSPAGPRLRRPQDRRRRRRPG